MRLNQLATELEIDEYSNSVNLDFFHDFLVGFFLPPSIPWVPFNVVSGDLTASHQATELFDAAN